MDMKKITELGAEIAEASALVETLDAAYQAAFMSLQDARNRLAAIKTVFTQEVWSGLDDATINSRPRVPRG